MERWGEEERLTTETMKRLREDGFNSLEDLVLLTTERIKAQYSNKNRLDTEQSFRLENAVQKLRLESTQLQVVDQSQDVRFLLAGKTGVGKSTTGNTILGGQYFSTSMEFSSETSKCEIHRAVVLGENIEVVDTPGLFDTSFKEEAIAQVIVQAVACMQPGPDVVLFLVKIGTRFTQEEAGTYKRLIAIFDESVTKHMIVVFTGGDLLGPGTTINVILDRSPSDLQSILKACENRYVVFNNNSSDERQVRRLLDVARDLMQKNGNKCYKCPKYFFVEEKMKEVIQQRMASVEKMESENKVYYKELQAKEKQMNENIKKERAMFEQLEQEREKQRKENEAVMDKKLLEIEEKLQKNLVSSKERDEEMAKLRQEMAAQAEADKKKHEEEIKAFYQREYKMREEQEKTRQEYEKKIMLNELNRLRDQIAANEEKGLVATLVDGAADVIKKGWNAVWNFFF